MTASNIFKMEMYRNFRDRAYLIVIGVLTGLFALATVLGIILILQGQSGTQTSGGFVTLMAIEFSLIFALVLSFAAFSVIYPWHLLSTDYNNKVLSLVVASGVKRSNYYFVKLLATILSSLLAYLVIAVIPVVLLLGFFHKNFLEVMQQIIRGLTFGQSWFILLSLLVSSIATMTILYFVVILTKGKFWGLFVFLGIRLGLGMIVSTINLSLRMTGGLTGSTMGSPILSLVLALVEIIAFGLVGFLMLKRQDL